MGLGYQFNKARESLRNLSPADRDTLTRLCHGIRQAEEDLREAAAEALENCQAKCQGICCRNVDLDAVLGLPDFVYILNMAPHLEEKTAACLKNESALYVSDCIFLENGVGPCIFPNTVMPEVCLTTFCGDETPARGEIKRLKWRFFRLSLFLNTLGLRKVFRSLFGTINKERK